MWGDELKSVEYWKEWIKGYTLYVNRISDSIDNTPCSEKEQYGQVLEVFFELTTDSDMMSYLLGGKILKVLGDRISSNEVADGLDYITIINVGNVLSLVSPGTSIWSARLNPDDDGYEPWAAGPTTHRALEVSLDGLDMPKIETRQEMEAFIFAAKEIWNQIESTVE